MPRLMVTQVLFGEQLACLVRTATDAKAKGISVYTAGVGKVTEDPVFEELLRNQIASDNTLYQEVSDFTDLQGFADELAETIICDSTRRPVVDGRECSCQCNDGFLDPGDPTLPCIKITPEPTLAPTEAPTPAPPTAAPEPTLPPPEGSTQCLQDALDVFLVLDTSGSIAQVFGAYDQELDWALNVATSLLANGQNRVGILGFNDDVYPQFSLTSDIVEFQQHVQYMKTCFDCQPHGRTATHLALESAALELQASTNSGKQVIVLLTDGEPYMSSTEFTTSCGYAPDCTNFECDYVFSSQLMQVLSYTKDTTCLVEKSNAIKESGVLIYAVGVGEITRRISMLQVPCQQKQLPQPC